MKFTVEKSVFMEKLTPAMGTVSNKNTISSIEGVLIETMDDATVRISTYDMNKGVRATIPVTRVSEAGSFIIDAQRLYQTVRVLPDEELTFEVGEDMTFLVKCGKSSFSMSALPGAQFPNLPDLQTERGFHISSSVLRKMIVKVMHSIAEQDTRPMLCGAYFLIEGDRIEVASSDTFTLSVCNQVCEIENLGSEANGKFSFIIPGHALNEMIKILPDDEDHKVDVYLSRKHAIVRGEQIVFFTRTIDSEYFDYKRVIPTDNTICVELDRERLLEGLERANIIAEEKIQGSGKSYVKIKVEEQFLSLTSSSVNGKVYDEMDCVHEGDSIEIGFNCRYLINSIKAAEGEQIVIRMKGPTQVITIEPKEPQDDFTYFYMIFPIRMNG